MSGLSNVTAVSKDKEGRIFWVTLEKSYYSTLVKIVPALAVLMTGLLAHIGSPGSDSLMYFFFFLKLITRVWPLNEDMASQPQTGLDSFRYMCGQNDANK